MRKSPQLGGKREAPNALGCAINVFFRTSSYDVAHAEPRSRWKGKKGCAWEPQRKPLTAEDSLSPAVTRSTQDQPSRRQLLTSLKCSRPRCPLTQYGRLACHSPTAVTRCSCFPMHAAH